MRQPTASIVTLLVVTALAAGAQPRAWEVRYAQLSDQTEEWTEMGRIPGWRIEEGETPGSLHVGADEDGRFRGTILLGKRWSVPDPAPATIRLALEYQTFCAMHEAPYERSGEVALGVFTADRWAQFADEPQAARIWRDRRTADGILAMTQVHPNREDVTEWRSWESGPLRLTLGDHAGDELVVAVIWSAYHFVEEWAAFRNLEVATMSEAEVELEFLERVDLDHPGLGEFRDAMQREDIAAAKLALVDHFRSRTEPAGPPLQTEASEAVIARADEVLAHIFRSAGCPPTKIEGPLQWNEDPHDYDQWAIHLNRHFDWLNLGTAYAHTGDEKYAREFVALLNSWIDAMPVNIGRHYVQGPFFVPGRSPLTLDAGIRMAQTWWPAYYHFRNSASFDAESQFRVLQSFVQHADYLLTEEHFRVDSNWGAMEANGLFHIAVMMPEMRDSQLWLDTARERLVALLEAQVYPDGAQIELAPGYHGVTLNNLLGSLELARRTETDLPDELVGGLEMMFEYYARIAMPDGRSPALNDSSWGGVDGWLARGLELFPHRADFEYIMSDEGRGDAPDYVSTFLPWAGWAIMRTGWTPRDRYLLMEAGPFGRAHQHEDKLGIICHVAGKTVLTEGGTYSYDRSAWREYVLSTRAHNTVMVDGLEQNRRAARDTWISEEPVDARWFSDDDFDFARGVYDSGYGPENAVRVAHERQVLFVRPDYWIVCDTMTPEDDAEHTYEALFHLDADAAEVDQTTGAVSVAIGEAGFRILPVGAQAHEVEIVSGQTEPAVQGWLPAGGHGNLRPIPTAIFRWKATGPSTVAFLLLPREAGEGWPIMTARAIEAQGGFALQAEHADGASDVFVRAAGGGAIVADICATDADAAMVRLSADGSATSTFSSGGSRLEVR